MADRCCEHSASDHDEDVCWTCQESGHQSPPDRQYTLRVCPECGMQWLNDVGPGCHAEDPITVPAVRVPADARTWLIEFQNNSVVKLRDDSWTPAGTVVQVVEVAS